MKGFISVEAEAGEGPQGAPMQPDTHCTLCLPLPSQSVPLEPPAPSCHADSAVIGNGLYHPIPEGSGNTCPGHIITGWASSSLQTIMLLWLLPTTPSGAGRSPTPARAGLAGSPSCGDVASMQHLHGMSQWGPEQTLATPAPPRAGNGQRASQPQQ